MRAATTPLAEALQVSEKIPADPTDRRAGATPTRFGPPPGARLDRAPGGVLAVCAAVRLRLAPTPLERDEGEYAYAARLVREGVPPYRLAYDMKFPGAVYAYAAMF